CNCSGTRRRGMSRGSSVWSLRMPDPQREARRRSRRAPPHMRWNASLLPLSRIGRGHAARAGEHVYGVEIANSPFRTVRATEGGEGGCDALGLEPLPGFLRLPDVD